MGSQRDPLAEPYLVDMRMLSCTCPDSRKMGRTGICKHVRYVGLVRYMLKGVRMPEGAFTHRTGVRNSHISALLGGRVDSQGFPEPQIFFQRMVEADRLACILGDDDTPYTGDLLHTSRFGGNLEFAVFLLSNYFGRNENQRAITINQRLSPLIASLGNTLLLSLSVSLFLSFLLALFFCLGLLFTPLLLRQGGKQRALQDPTGELPDPGMEQADPDHRHDPQGARRVHLQHRDVRGRVRLRLRKV